MSRLISKSFKSQQWKWNTVLIEHRIPCAKFSHACYLNIALGKDYMLTFQKKKTHYEVLGLNQNASTAQIKMAYIKLSKKFHPDCNGSDSTSHMKFIEINEAYSILSSHESRRNYNSTLGFHDNHYETDHPYFHARAKQYRQRQYSSAYNNSNHSYGDFSSRRNDHYSHSEKHEFDDETKTYKSILVGELIAVCVIAAGFISFKVMFPHGFVPVEVQNSSDEPSNMEMIISSSMESQSSAAPEEWQCSEHSELEPNQHNFTYPPGQFITAHGQKVPIKDIVV